MNDWKGATKAQLFFAQRILHEINEQDSKSLSQAQTKYHVNALILVLRELWVCALNEWAGYFAPKKRLPKIQSWNELERAYESYPDIQHIRQEIRKPDSWVRGFVELEGLSSTDWLEASITSNKSDYADRQLSPNDQPQQAHDALSLVEVQLRPRSVMNGLEDLTDMLDGLKQLINDLRSQHAEW